jgi:molybdopterin molybdotransferase
MVSFDEAIQLIRSQQIPLGHYKLPLAQAQGLRLAQDIFASVDLPLFDNSAVDGYAIDSKSNAASLPIALQIFAVGQEKLVLKPSTAALITTGAPMPEGADAVIMKEEVIKKDQHIYFNRAVKSLDHVRRQGEDIKKNTLVAKQGSEVTPQLIGVLAALGLSEIPIFRPPKIAIIATGDELVLPGLFLKWGQVYYLMGPMLKAQCFSLKINDVVDVQVSDDETAILQAIHEAAQADVILLTGGMSLGDRDLVIKVLQKIGVLEIFYRGAFRPGHPLFFGRKDQIYFFGLPGNPVAAFVGFHVFVRALIMNAMKAPNILPTKTAILKNDFNKPPGFTFFARAIVNDNNEMTILPGQGSHQIFNLSLANALALIPAQRGLVKADEPIHYFPI